MADKNMIDPAAGVLLVATENMMDSNFGRTVILMCEHRDEGSFGLVLNQPLEVRISELLETYGWDCQVFRGGPVERNSLHLLHCRGDIDIGSQEILPGVFWGGDFSRLNNMLSEGVVEPSECRFFLGYSGWGEGQLVGEIERDSWYLTRATKELIFRENNVNHWRETLKHMGPDYKLVSSFPDDPRLN